ncbi:sensor histidine kinase [Actinocatenispora rupis]|uniref:histidine kinase n=1 Tax=Actinocatenispora rupis TaxID=519421 RepID=A0A8J3N9L2_9ACTN|nr:ATP-binding protein [Actinocatenispora rupis]GID11419.1 hypothetical protein Aru02nite_23080 [Actinocatenispora rupis]
MRSRGGFRRLWAGALGVAGLAVLTVALTPFRADVSVAALSLLLLVPVLAAAVTGGVWPGLGTAVLADLALNFFFVPPYRTFVVERGDNVIVLVVYVLVAATVAVAVDAAVRQRERAARRDAEAAVLARATTRPAAEQSLPDLLDAVRRMFGMTAAALLEDDGTGERVVARVGESGDAEPAISASAGAGLRLVGWGPPVFAEDRGALARIAAAAARTLEAHRLSDEAARARQLAEVDRLRAALLAAVGHDLRTPLASIKAAVSSLRAPDIEFPPDVTAELLATVEESTDRLTALVDNLLSMSRLSAGAVIAHPRPVPLDAVVAAALMHLPADSVPVDVDVPDDLPLVRADAGLLERVVANLVANARAVSTPDHPVRLVGRTDGGYVRLRIVDRGPGVPDADKERIFTPFQRLGDRTADGGLGLGLAIARGFTEATDGTLTPTDTPGGGLTMTLRIPLAATDPP